MDEGKRPRGRPKGTTKRDAVRRMSEVELQQFFAAVKGEPKLRLLFNLTLYFGLRAIEAATLKLSDIDRRSRVITISGAKAGSTRQYQPDEIRPELWPQIDRWLRIRRRTADTRNPYLFPHRYKAKGLDSMTAIGVESGFKGVCRIAGILGHSAHDLRHSRGHQLADLGQSALQIASWLRQRDSASALIYVRNFESRQAGRQTADRSTVY